MQTGTAQAACAALLALALTQDASAQEAPLAIAVLAPPAPAAVAGAFAAPVDVAQGPAAARADAEADALAAAASSAAAPASDPEPSAEPEPDPLFDDYDDEFGDEFSERDPLERGNRAIFAFNRKFDAYLLKPLVTGYRFVVPDPGRRAIRRLFLNLNTPAIFVNNLLQLRFRDAAETIGRFALNTTLGVGGLLDPAVEAGWEYRSADFGETLAFMGVASGPYIIMPMLGPSTMRDGIGQVVDRVFHPLTFVIGLVPNLLIMGGGEGFSMREQYLDELEALEESSIDYYAVLRAAYFQQRDKQLEDNRAGASARVADSR